MNKNLSINKAFKEQAKICLKTTFSTTTLSHISKILLKPDTRVLALVMFHENRKKCKENFRVLSFLIYTNKINYVCIDSLGSERKILSYLRPGPGGSYKNFNKSYDNVLGFGIPDLFMDLLSCCGFLKNNYSIVVLKFPNRMFEYHFKK